MGFPIIGEGPYVTVREDKRLGISVLEDVPDCRRGVWDPPAWTKKGRK